MSPGPAPEVELMGEAGAGVLVWAAAEPTQIRPPTAKDKSELAILFFVVMRLFTSDIWLQYLKPGLPL